MEVALKRAGAVHGGLFLVALGAGLLVAPPLTWPWYLLLPLLAYGCIVLLFSPLRRTATVISIGRVSGPPLLCAIILSVATTVALTAFHSWVRPDVTELAGRIPIAAFGNLPLAAICFSILNATLEELVFRGVLWEAIAEEWNNGVALVATSVFFGVGHLHGYPPGVVGAVLAGMYGIALGLLRWWTGGLGLAIASHVCADATIFTLLWWSGAFAETVD
jgi:membrane protease YdiL (CAAX protease family)